MIKTVNAKDYPEDNSFALIPPGKYLCSVNEIKETKTKTQGDDMMNVSFVILEGDYTGRLIFTNIVIPDKDSPAAKAMGICRHFLHCIGEEYTGESFKINTDHWIGKEIYMEIHHKTGEDGITRAQVKKYILLGEDGTESGRNVEVKEKDAECPF